ncbi:MAG: hypothetical protein NT091_02035, partial [Candidatus Falkowbacteria bacterium]|nr:hypothetical protein [Candidatus Falkowbacteria bacterium]
ELVTGLLKNHIYWTNFFKFLEGEISNNVYIEGFSGTSAGQYTLSAKARDFNTIAEQIKSLRKNEYVVDVSTGGGTVTKSEVNDSEIVSFNLSLKVDQKLFQK